jgi:octaheme c-type cytochrome (tetrathionate reductase family)
VEQKRENAKADKNSAIQLNKEKGVRFLYISLLAGLLALPWLVPVMADSGGPGIHPPPGPHREQQGSTKPGKTADHSKFEELQVDFTNGPAVTKACLGCHTEAGEQFKHSIHWTWDYTDPVTGQKLGKSRLINNFCTNARGNEGMCAQCHAGYNWVDQEFDFTNHTNMDCLVCHERDGGYYKTPATQGNAACSIMFEGKKPIDFQEVAQSVALPERRNCGGCHFYGGGGDGVKHGDLDSSLTYPPKELDVHMDATGLNYACTACHVTENHISAGSRYHILAKDTEGTGKPGERRDVASCESCHSDHPHSSGLLEATLLNDHVKRVACQTCHIPEFARGGVATETYWDWRTAGKVDEKGEGFKEEKYVQGNGAHRATYKSIKGSFTWDENIVPEYRWFDGQMIYTTIDTRIDASQQPVPINWFKGSANDPASRIWPFKLMRTHQPYDAGNNTLVYMHLWGEDDSAYWGNYDFSKAIEAGMERNAIPYSGEYDFIETVSFWPITHMVPPKENALDCSSCHAREGRLKNLKGFYMPGRDSNFWIDRLGILAIVAALLGVFAHGLIRLFTAKGKH